MGMAANTLADIRDYLIIALCLFWLLMMAVAAAKGRMRG